MQREIGTTGVSVFPVGLGAMPLSIQGRPPEADAIRTLHAAFDAGVNLVDTANVYCLDDSEIGHNERLIRKAIAGYGAARVHVATKGGMRRPAARWERDGRPEQLRQACEQSLRDLGVEAIFLYQLHVPDPQVPLEESVGALAELQAQGKLRHIGVSNVAVEQARLALGVARIESIQNRANPFCKADYQSSGVIDLCEEQGLTFLPYSTGRGQRHHREANAHAVLEWIASAHGVSAYEVSIARAPVPPACA